MKGGVVTHPSEKIPDVKVTVQSIKGKCALGHKVGEEFVCPDSKNLVVFEIRRVKS